MYRGVKAVFKLAPKPVRDRMKAKKPMTPKQKIAALKAARALLETNYGHGDWQQFVNGVERFCLYGAVEVVCGVTPADTSDEKVSACSLTETMYNAVSPRNQRKIVAEGNIADYRERSDPDFDGWYPLTPAKAERRIMNERVACLQAINDNGDKRAVLRIVDNAIKALEQQA